ncbi:MAG: ATP-binding protein [Candidatus Heimdallarchaeota archaeon]|nr:ATP-binding protein [Candidatus Heimdallarchaeota archaeon]MCK4254885.1 ATP-binding protein [Candidatus Heimdallarchaeota archaeon]
MYEYSLDHGQESLLLRLFDKMKKGGSIYFHYTPSSPDEYECFESLEVFDLVTMPSETLGLGLYSLTPQAFNIVDLIDDTFNLENILNSLIQTFREKRIHSTEDLVEIINKNDFIEGELNLVIYYGVKIGLFETIRSVGLILPSRVKITYEGRKFFDSPFVVETYLKLDERFFKNNYKDDVILNWITKSANGGEDFELEFKRSADYSTVRKLVCCFSNSKSGVLCIGFNNDGILSGLDSPDNTRNQVLSSIRDLENIDIIVRNLRDSANNAGIIVLIAKREQPVIIGNTMWIRQDTSCIKVDRIKSIVKIIEDLQESQSGHLWLKSLRKFASS